jgi:VIT1/CCC1 family predicted Fe2+/Mn2+ transporter
VYIAVTVPLARQQEPGHVHSDSEEGIPYPHEHFSQRGTWLRAAVLGANDGLVTVGALMTGISAAGTSQHQLILSAVAALISGAKTYSTCSE